MVINNVFNILCVFSWNKDIRGKLQNNHSNTNPHPHPLHQMNILRITETSICTFTEKVISYFYRDSNRGPSSPNYAVRGVNYFGATAPQWAWVSSFTRFLDHTQRRTTVGRTPLDEGSARRRDL